MKFDKIVGFGDSFMWGDELVDPMLKAKHTCPEPYWQENIKYREQNCFLGLLAQHYQVPCENFGWPGGSMQSAKWCYLWWKQHEVLPLNRCLVLVCHTGANRESYYNRRRHMFANDPPWHKFVHSSWVHHAKADVESEWSSMVKQHFTLTDCLELRILRYQESLMFWQGVQTYHAAVLQFCSIDPPIPDCATNSVLTDRSLQNLICQDSNLSCEHGHPNEKGHQVIRDLLITEIDRAIIAL